MPSLNELIPDGAAVIALEPDELGLRLLPVIATIQTVIHSRNLETLVALYARQGAPGQGAVLGVPYPPEHRQGITVALREAWYWLLGAGLLIPSQHRSDSVDLSRRAERLAAQPDPFASYGARSLPRTALREELQGDVWSAFQRGKFPTAVFEAMRAVEVAVRESAGFGQGEHGVPMIRRAFGPTGALTDREAEVAEQEAAAALFAGAIGSYKNPHSHRHVELNDPDEAAEMILLANHLLRIVAARR